MRDVALKEGGIRSPFRTALAVLRPRLASGRAFGRFSRAVAARHLSKDAVFLMDVTTCVTGRVTACDGFCDWSNFYKPLTINICDAVTAPDPPKAPLLRFAASGNGHKLNRGHSMKKSQRAWRRSRRYGAPRRRKGAGSPKVDQGKSR